MPKQIRDSSTGTQYQDYPYFHRTYDSISIAEAQPLSYQSPHQGGGGVADSALPEQSWDFVSLAEHPLSSNYASSNTHHNFEGNQALLSPCPPYISAIQAEEGMRGMIPMQRFQSSASPHQHFELETQPQGQLTQPPIVPNTSLVPAHRGRQHQNQSDQNRHCHFHRESRSQSPQTPTQSGHSSPSVTQSSLLSTPSSTSSFSAIDPGTVTRDGNNFLGVGAQFFPYTGQEHEQMLSLDEVLYET